jgi:hypothetical protein
MLEINYKKKYLELRGKYIADLDMAFRLGMEQGQQQAQQQQALDAQAKAEDMAHQQAAAAAGGMGGEGQPGQPESGQPSGSVQPPGEENGPDSGAASVGMERPSGSELDQHISRLEGMLGNGEGNDPQKDAAIKKSLDAIKSFRKADLLAIEMKKSEQAIKSIAKALHTPAYKFGVQAQHNLSKNAKETVSLQHKMVNDIMKSWEKEEAKAANSLETVINASNLLKS